MGAVGGLPLTSHHSRQGKWHMTSAELTTENELSGSILGLIDAYRMGEALDAQDLYERKTTTEVPPQDRGFVPADGYFSDGV